MEKLPLDFGVQDEATESLQEAAVPSPPSRSSTKDEAAATDATGSEQQTTVSLPEGHIVDYITNESVPETPKEQVRQRIAFALTYEYGIGPENMARDFSVSVEDEEGKKRRRRADIAIFAEGQEHTQANLRRVVVCKPQPKVSKVTRIRTEKQAEKDLEELTALMRGEELKECTLGLWTNGLEMFFLHKQPSDWFIQFEEVSDWPPFGDEAADSQTYATRAALRLADKEMLKWAFRRSHNYIHGNEGMPKDAAFWQFLYLLFAKMHDERVSRDNGTPRRFYAGARDPYTDKGRSRISRDVRELFEEVKEQSPDLFGARDELTLSERALAFIVSELAPYDLSATDVDAKGIAYQELVGNNLRGDRGQYFTPRSVVDLMVEILAPGEDETVLDPCCGTGGFLRSAMEYRLDRWRAKDGTSHHPDTVEQRKVFRARLANYSQKHVFGCDFDPFLVRATQMSVLMLSGVEGNIYHLDSLAFPDGHLSGRQEANENIPLGSVDVLLTNPPFGSDIKITDPDILEGYRRGVARSWSRDRETGELVTSGAPVSAMTPEQLFVQRAVEWVKPGGRIGIVLPNGILSNPGPMDEAIREWILENCWVLASIEMPVEAFISEANVNILTTLLFLKRKTPQEIDDERTGEAVDYPIFMATAEKVGVDRRGNPIYKRDPLGKVVSQVKPAYQSSRTAKSGKTQIVHRKVPVLDNDIPGIIANYRAFRARYPAPGAPGEARG